MVTILNRAAVLRRPGWTPTLLRDFLGEPDRREPNCPGYRDFSLYCIERVIAAEGSPDFERAVAKSRARSRATKRSAATKRKSLACEADALQIEVQRLSIDEIVVRLRAQDPGFPRSYRREALDSWCAHFVLEHLTNFTVLAADFEGRVGGSEASERLLRRTLREIGVVYPDLATACRRGPSARLPLVTFAEFWRRAE